MTTNDDRDQQLIDQGLLRQDEVRLSQKVKRTLIDLRQRINTLEHNASTAEVGQSDSAISLINGMERRVVGDKYTDVSVALDPAHRRFEYIDMQLVRHGAWKGWVQVMGSRQCEVVLQSSNVFYIRPRPYDADLKKG